MNKLLLLSLICVSSVMFSQTTKELYSLPGLTFIYNTQDDTFQEFEHSSFFIRDTIISDVEFLEFKNKGCYSSYYRVEDSKIWLQNYSMTEEYLYFDFDSDIGDTLSLRMLLQPSGYFFLDFIVVEKDQSVFDDSISRRRYRVEALDNYNWSIEFVEGFLFAEWDIKCITSNESNIFRSQGFTDDECFRRSCCDIWLHFEVVEDENTVKVKNLSRNSPNLSWDMGDGTTFFEQDSFSYTYDDFGCFEIRASSYNECGDEGSRVYYFNHCVDSLWIKTNDLIFKDIAMTSDLAGWAITDSIVYYTENGGVDWIERKFPHIDTSVVQRPKSIDMFDSQVGILLMSASKYTVTAFVTMDGGSNWSLLQGDFPEIYTPDEAVIGNDGYIFIRNGSRIYRSFDWGQNWIELDRNSDATWIRDFEYFGDGKVVLAASNYGYPEDLSIIRVSNDYGYSWKEFTYPALFHFSSIDFINENIGYSCGRNHVWKTTDGGSSWEIMTSYDDNRSFEDIEFIDEENGILLSTNNVYRTSDGGSSWQVELCKNSNDLRDLVITYGRQYLIHRDGFYTYSPDPDFDCGEVNTDEEQKIDISLYPNPTNDILYLEGIDDLTSSSNWIEIHDIEGRLIDKMPRAREVDVSGYPSGIYFLSIYDGGGVLLQTEKIVKF